MATVAANKTTCAVTVESNYLKFIPQKDTKTPLRSNA